MQGPALIVDGVHLSGVTSIAQYLAPASLKGSNPLEEAYVLQWLHLAEHELLPAVLSLISDSPTAKASRARARQEVDQHLGVLNKILLTSTYLVGETVTLADLAVTCVLLPAFQLILDESARSKTLNVVRWLTTIAEQPNVKFVIGNLQLKS